LFVPGSKRRGSVQEPAERCDQGRIARLAGGRADHDHDVNRRQSAVLSERFPGESFQPVALHGLARLLLRDGEAEPGLATRAVAPRRDQYREETVDQSPWVGCEDVAVIFPRQQSPVARKSRPPRSGTVVWQCDDPDLRYQLGATFGASRA
jgi:hypothetical protein